MDQDKYFEKLEELAEEVKGKKMPDTLKVTITYSTGENDVFNVSIAFWTNMMLATKNRLKYLYHRNRLISLDHVVKMEYEELEHKELEE